MLTLVHPVAGHALSGAATTEGAMVRATNDIVVPNVGLHFAPAFTSNRTVKNDAIFGDPYS